MKLTLGEWLPDQATVNGPGLVLSTNALPAATHYRSWQAPLPIVGPQIFQYPYQGLFLGYRPNGGIWMIVGSAAALTLQTTPGGAAQFFGGPYSLTEFDRWRGVQHENALILTSYVDPIQVCDLGGVGGFTVLGGSPPKARYIAIIKGFVVVAYTNDNVDGEVANRVRWHGYVNGLPDITSWAVSASTQADFQDVSGIGQITGLTGGEFGTVLGTKGIVRMTFGGPALFDFAVVERGVGCEIPQSVVQYGQQTFFLGQDGFYAFNGSQAQPIGRERVDRWFAADYTHGLEHRMWAAVDTENGLVCWLYPGVGAVDGVPNRMLVYHVTLNRWSVIHINAQWIGEVMSFGLDLDNEQQFPNLDTDDRNLDDPRLWADLPRFGCIMPTGHISAFIGPPLPATFQFNELELAEGRRAVVKSAIVEHDGGSATVQIGKRERLGPNNQIAWSNPHPRQADGWYRMREAAHYHTPRLDLIDWQKANAVELEATALGRR